MERSESITVEIFRTNVSSAAVAQQLALRLNDQFPGFDVHFDWQDCDRILRVAGAEISPDQIVAHLHAEGFWCEWWCD